jgi:two-component system CheB/CheR fusion protein
MARKKKNDKAQEEGLKQEAGVEDERQEHPPVESTGHAPEEQETPFQPEPKQTFPIVGIGASAGGLEAFEAFFEQMPPDSGMAFVLVQHLDPDHESILVDLLKRATQMPVFQVTDGMTVQPDNIYVIPPNRNMALLNGVLQLLEPTEPRGFRMPIDYLFRSLADDQVDRAICIILSGTGTDGTLGLRAIRGEGGMSMAQDPETAKYNGMPLSAINSGLVDYILPPDKMPEQLRSYGERFYTTAAPPDQTRLFPVQAKHHQPPD